MNRFIALFALVAVAFAEPESKPEADPQWLSYGMYGVHPSHATVGAQVYANGAVVPQDTLSVKAAKAQHFTAKANEYAKKGISPFYSGIYSPYTAGVYGAHMLGKREAESDSDAYMTYGAYSPYTTGYSGLGYAGLGYSGVYGGYSTPYSTYGSVYGGHYLGKREAESDSDAYMTYGAYSPYTTGYTGLGYAGLGYGSVYGGYSTPYSTYGSMYGGHYLGKREAESDSDAYMTYGAYSPYTTGYSGLGYAGLGYSGVYGAYSTPYSTYGSVYGGHYLGKREAEADSYWPYSGYGSAYRTGYASPYYNRAYGYSGLGYNRGVYGYGY